MDKIIKLEAKPVIKHKLEETGLKVKKRIEELSLSKQVASEDTIKSLKETRAQLNKEHTQYKNDIKLVLSPVTDSVDALRNSFKENITTIYNDADKVLKEKINNFELKLKNEKREQLKLYFKELCDSNDVDFIDFSNLNLNITLSRSLKSYRDEIDSFVSSKLDDIELINSDIHAVEMLTEYKSNGLNASKAITDVRQRKENERIEKEKKQAAIYNKRASELRSMTFVRSDMPPMFYYVPDNSISVDDAEIANASDEEWAIRISEIKDSIKDLNDYSLKKPTIETGSKPQKESEIKTARFEVKADVIKLKLLATFLKENKIDFKTLK